MLSLLANKAKALVQKQGQLMLEKPHQADDDAGLMPQEMATISASATPACTTSPTSLPISAWATGDT